MQRALSSCQVGGDTEIIYASGIDIRQAERTGWGLAQLGSASECMGKVAYIQRYITI